MGSKPPAAPASAVSTADLTGAWNNANDAIGSAGTNTIPADVWQTYGSDLMSPTPYGYDPKQGMDMGRMWQQQGPKMFAAGDAVLQQGMDPQNELYNRTAGQVQNQTRAGQAARGIMNDPYGASVEGGVMKDFNIDWQNAQLQRMVQAIQGGSTAYGSGGNAIAGGEAMMQGIPNNMAAYAGNLQQLGMNTTVPDQWQAGAYSNLFGTGSSAQANAYQNQLAAYKQKQADSQAMWSGIGKIAGVAAAPFTGGASLALTGGSMMGGR